MIAHFKIISCLALIITALQVNISAKEKQILFCWSKPDHPIGTHIYPTFAKHMSKEVSKLDNYKATTVEGFPSEEQWENCDLAVFYLTIKSLSPEQYQLIDHHLKKGKGLVFLHQALVHRKDHQKLADRIGYSFSWDKNSKSNWGKFSAQLQLDTSHPILINMPKTLPIEDELYWNLCRGNQGKLTLLGKTQPSLLRNQNNATTWPVIWTVEHENDSAKEGRVFTSVIGHFSRLYHSKDYMSIILSGMAWSIREPTNTFQPILSNLPK